MRIIRRFRDLSIQRKQTLIMMLTSGVTLLLACAAFVAYDMVTFRRELVEQVSSLAEVVGNTITGALDFNDPKSATEALAALRGEPNVVAAAIYDKEGRVFAIYQSNGDGTWTPPLVKATSYEYTAESLRLSRTITHDGETVGTIYIVSNLEEFTERLIRYAGIVGIVLLGSLLVSLMLSNWLQRLISGPILHLAQVIRSVALEKNYSVRANKRGDDELGRLIDGFNEMLAQIQERDRALESARDNLEQRVGERTQELSSSLSLLNATLEASTDAILALDREGEITCYNKQFIELWKFPPEVVARLDVEEMVNFAASQLKDPETFRAEASRTEKSPEKETQGVLEFRDGRIVERLTKPQYLGAKCSGSVVTLRDITERKRAMAALSVSEERFRSVWERSIEGMRLTDRDGRIVAVNEAYCQLVRLPREKLMGQIFSVTYKSSGPADDLAVYQQRFDTGTIEPRFELRVELWNSEEVDIEVSSSFIESGQQGRMILSLFRDATERKQTEKQLKSAQSELLQTSRQAGMAEVATSVLHNVGNVLNSVNTSASVIVERVKGSKGNDLSRVVELLETNRADLGNFLMTGQRADQVINFLKTLAHHLASEQTKALHELTDLAKNIEHIKEIVAMQQSYARVSGVTEKVHLSDLIEDALRMNTGGLTRHQVELVREYPDQLPEMTVDKHKVLQILVNLIRNAKYACDDSGSNEKRLILRVTNGGDQICIEVIDNGVGIPPENLTRIFSHGFTTRKEGHGFGLHSGALAAKELGGALSVHSDGPGKGATFTLELPIQPKNRL